MRALRAPRGRKMWIDHDPSIPIPPSILIRTSILRMRVPRAIRAPHGREMRIDWDPPIPIPPMPIPSIPNPPSILRMRVPRGRAIRARCPRPARGRSRAAARARRRTRTPRPRPPSAGSRPSCPVSSSNLSTCGEFRNLRPGGRATSARNRRSRRGWIGRQGGRCVSVELPRRGARDQQRHAPAVPIRRGEAGDAARRRHRAIDQRRRVGLRIFRRARGCGAAVRGSVPGMRRVPGMRGVRGMMAVGMRRGRFLAAGAHGARGGGRLRPGEAEKEEQGKGASHAQRYPPESFAATRRRRAGGSRRGVRRCIFGAVRTTRRNRRIWR